MSEFGKKFDPTVDRLLFIVALVAIIIDGAAPLWFCVAVLVREVLVGGTIAIATLVFGMERFDVSWWGKLATVAADVRHPRLHARRPATSPATRCSRSPRGSSASPAWSSVWITAIGYVPKIRAGIAAGRASRAISVTSVTAEPAPPTSIRLPPMNVPEQLRYSSDHEWVSRDGDVVRIGITDYAQDALGDVVFVQVPDRRRRRSPPATRSARSRARSRCPTCTPRCRAPSSRSTRRSPTRPQALNEDPYGDGWICTIAMSDPAQFDALLDAAAYQALVEG